METPARSPDNKEGSTPPRGIDAVKNSLVQAAMDLLQSHPANQISARAIARRADVNYGLIHHYFGNKNQIFHQVFLELFNRITAAAKASGHEDWWRQPEIVSTQPEMWRMVANLVADVDLVESMGWEFPLMRSIASGMASENPEWDPTEVRARAATLGAALLGWSLLVPMFQRGLELDADELLRVRDRVLVIAAGTD